MNLFRSIPIIAAVLLVGLSPAPAADSATVLIAYFSQTGNTKSLAEAVQRGAASVEGVNVRLAPVAELTAEDAAAADAVIIGSPVYNANVAPEVQQFINSWPLEGMRDKIGAAFATGGGISSGEELVQLNLLHSMLVFRMIVVGGPAWRQAFGASATSEDPNYANRTPEQRQSEGEGRKAYFEAKAEALGKRVAELAIRLSDGR